MDKKSLHQKPIILDEVTQCVAERLANQQGLTLSEFLTKLIAEEYRKPRVITPSGFKSWASLNEEAL